MKLIIINNPKGDVLHYCPGCDSLHEITTQRKNSRGAQWKFDGNLQSPTFTPSCNYDLIKEMQCHYSIINGKIIYYSDCYHKLKDTTINMPEIPAEYL